MSTHTDEQVIPWRANDAHAAEHEHGGPALYATTLVALLILTGDHGGARRTSISAPATW